MNSQSSWRDRLRWNLATLESLPRLSLIAVICGLGTGALMVFFRLCIEGIQRTTLPAGLVANYEALSAVERFLFPVIGALLISAIIYFLPGRHRSTGVVHVLEALLRPRGRLPVGNAVWQFFGALAAISSGHSVGREGPSVHLGAAISALLGEWLHLPRNSIRVLIACGVAAAIAASFNTPLAGVIFSMEVVMAEYTVSGFVPVILSAVSATTLLRFFYGTAPAFALPMLDIQPLADIPLIILLGAVIGILAASFNRLLSYSTGRLQRLPIYYRPLLAGIVTGLFALYWPQIMGIGYDSVEAMLNGQLPLTLLLTLVFAKLVCTTFAIACGIPAGMIGPVFFIGAAAGGAFILLAGNTETISGSQSAFFVMLGMGAMMGATLQAPLAALTAMIELTASPEIILPGMLAVITAVLTSQELFHCPSIFTLLLRQRGLSDDNQRIHQLLSSISLTRVVSDDFFACHKTLTADERRRYSEKRPTWVIQVSQHGLPLGYVNGHEFHTVLATVANDKDPVDLQALPIPWQPAQLIEIQSDLAEAAHLFQESDAELLCVIHQWRNGNRLCGIVGRHSIEHYTSLYSQPPPTQGE